MFYLHLKNSYNPYFNLSIEETVLNDLGHDKSLFFLWKNKPSVIIGKNQILENEVNLDFCNSHKIPIIRRNSGGGAVFHDLGNINLSFLGNIKFDPAEIIVNTLKNFGLNCFKSGRNDILVNGKKIAGWAYYKKNNKELVHGCLLFSSNLALVQNTLKASDSKLKKHGVKSVKNRITSLKKESKISEKELIFSILREIQKEENLKPYLLSQKLLEKAKTLQQKKYENKNWNYNKRLQNTKSFRQQFSFGQIELNYLIQNSCFSIFNLSGDFFSNKDIAEFNQMCKNKTIVEIIELSSKINLNDYVFGLDLNTFKRILNNI